ncbi:MAG TPA: hypothetical protein VFV52_14490 [Bacilli bacterium]|nr:hypothetical protein [Bacilli bacterium]
MDTHPLYHRCRGLMHRDVTLHHVNGNSYHGVIRRVTPGGVYLGPAGQTISNEQTNGLDAMTTEQHNGENPDLQNVYFGAGFFPFGLLTGLTLGLAAGALTYPWGYGGWGYGGYYW